ncbi:hypothetical protein [Flavobacterium sp. MDT1-60]|uniref:hypothetical protein n=1 Tax=Flavobacterium sp. MDT1-60 TaxID=1979344 RepID=UPI0017808633|nr:hypothetical protein [Flavobacterium sp. MDT1-60]QOG02207.1 hypothetical protein IHE43_20860 [Flavobacterium sp. MDT1-60]
MKKIILLLAILISQISCNNDKETKPKDTGILGTWKLAESFVGEGASATKWASVTNGYTHTFKSDGTFTSTQFTECTKGIYKLENTTLTMIYGCPGFTTTKEKPTGTFIENYKIENGKMHLSPINLLCFEGCEFKFIKIK